jgi:hypothetical protein
MDHQDWPGWPDDGPPPHDDPADPGGHHGWDPDPLGHERPDDGGFGPDPYGHDRLDADPGGPGHPGGDDEPATGHGHLGTSDEAYPDDDPFAPADHDDHVGYAGAEGLDADHDGPLPHDQVQVDPLGLEYPVGADPDIGVGGDVDWPQHAFPPPLDLPDVPEPVDGYPWADPRLLGSDVAVDDHSAPVGEPDRYSAPDGYGEPDDHRPPVADLYEYAGEEYAGEEYAGDESGGGWPELIASEDPATGALARWWAPRP